jgi:hypothetical protein
VALVGVKTPFVGVELPNRVLRKTYATATH